MEKNLEKSIPTRIPKEMHKKLKKIGNGDIRRGLKICMENQEKINRDPSLLLLNELEYFGNLIHTHLPDNHHNHYVESRLPVVLRRFIVTGHVDMEFIKKVRNDKKLDEFEEENATKND